MRSSVVVACVIPAVLAAGVVRADDPGERSARRHFERGEKLFALKKFDEALEEYQKAFDAHPVPDFLFNIGQCYRNLGDYEAAVFSYKKFLKLDPEAENRPKVEKLIADLEAKIDQGNTEKLDLKPKKKRASERPEPGAEAGAEGAPVYKKWWFWTAIAVGAAAAGTGIYFATRSAGTPDADYGIVFTK